MTRSMCVSTLRSRGICWRPSSVSRRLGVFVLVGLGPGLAAAHNQNGALGSGAAATDYYQIVCSDDGAGPPQSLTVQIRDEAPVAAPLVSVQVRAGDQLANTTDATDGDASLSPAIHVNGGPQAVYEVLVDKSAAGSENYLLTFHCVTGPDGTGLHTGTDLFVRQNQ